MHPRILFTCQLSFHIKANLQQPAILSNVKHFLKNVLSSNISQCVIYHIHTGHMFIHIEHHIHNTNINLVACQARLFIMWLSVPGCHGYNFINGIRELGLVHAQQIGAVV